MNLIFIVMFHIKFHNKINICLIPFKIVNITFTARWSYTSKYINIALKLSRLYFEETLEFMWNLCVRIYAENLIFLLNTNVINTESKVTTEIDRIMITSKFFESRC